MKDGWIWAIEFELTAHTGAGFSAFADRLTAFVEYRPSALASAGSSKRAEGPDPAADSAADAAVGRNGVEKFLLSMTFQ